MKQCNALRRLEVMLDEAVASGDRNELSGPILLRAMRLSEQPQNLLDFYELLSKAKEEAIKLKALPKIDRYLQPLEGLHQIFILNHAWGTQWNTFATHISNSGILITLDALANYFHSQNPTIFLEQDFLEKLNSEFESILNRICQSDLSKDLQRFLIKRLEDILQSIRRYYVDGTEGLEKAAQSLVSDLVMKEHVLKDEDKKDPLYKRIRAWLLGFLLYIAPSPYDIIGAVPDINDFWVPKFEELVAGCEKVEQISCETPTLQEAFEKASSIFDRQPQKSITGGKELKALPAHKEGLQVSTGDESDL
jgi:hypothetical protein